MSTPPLRNRAQTKISKYEHAQSGTKHSLNSFGTTFGDLVLHHHVINELVSQSLALMASTIFENGKKVVEPQEGTTHHVVLVESNRHEVAQHVVLVVSTCHEVVLIQ